MLMTVGVQLVKVIYFLFEILNDRNHHRLLDILDYDFKVLLFSDILVTNFM